jgi:hypothetical protein
MTKLLIMPTKAETASVVEEVEEVFRQGFALSVQAGSFPSSLSFPRHRSVTDCIKRFSFRYKGLKQCLNQGRKIGEHVRAEDGRRFSVGLLHMTPMKSVFLFLLSLPTEC